MNAFDKVIGYSSEKRELQLIADTLKNRDYYDTLGVSSPRGLLLYGEPGVGKTLMANALIEASGRRAFTCRKNQPDGDFVKAIAATFEQAAENEPSIVFLDDMDKFANEDMGHRNAEEYVTVQSCIDEVKGKEVFVLATANNLRNLPDSLLRAGRFDRHIEITAPHGEDAKAIIAHYLSGKHYVSDLNVETIARIMDGRSCAELETVINEAGLYAGYERSGTITMDCFLKACLRIIYDVPDSAFQTDHSKLNPQVLYHEAGHAVVSEVLCPGSVSLISAYNSKFRDGGFVTCYKDESWSEAEWMNRSLMTYLGGMTAVDQKFGVADVGATSDLNNAFQMVIRITERFCFRGLQLHGTLDESEALKMAREQAATAELERCQQRVKAILIQNSDFLEKVATALSETGLLTRDDMINIKRTCTINDTLLPLY